MKRRTKYVAVTTVTLALLAFLGSIGYWAYTGWLNYHGYCFIEKRYLTDEERIRKSAERLFDVRQGILPPFWPLEDKELEVMKGEDGKSLWALRRAKGLRLLKNSEGQWVKNDLPALNERPVEPVPYRSLGEFFALNPNCCDIARYFDAGSEGGWEFDLWDRVNGYGSAGVVWMSYRYRYRDHAGIEREGNDGFVQELIDNCGNGLEAPMQ